MKDDGLPVFPDLRGRVAIVTGASRGIGCGIARVLGAQGMKLVLTARSEDKGLAFLDELKSDGTDGVWVTADCGTKEGARRILDATLDRYDTPHVLVNNAASLRSTAFQDTDEETYARAFEKNMRLVYEMSQPVTHAMQQAGRGVILNLSSVAGLRAHRRNAAYGAAKGAIDALTRCMAVDLAPFGIRVNGIAPGATRSPRHDLPEYAEKVHNVETGVPLARMGTPQDIGCAAAFLASDAASYITGQILYVDGGLTAQLTPPGLWI